MHSFKLQESVFNTSSGASGFSYSESMPVKPATKKYDLTNELCVYKQLPVYTVYRYIHNSYEVSDTARRLNH